MGLYSDTLQMVPCLINIAGILDTALQDLSEDSRNL